MKHLKGINEDLTGWVNVKIDKEVFFRIKRFIKAIDSRTGAVAFDDKLKYISNPIKYKYGSKNENIQRQMAGIILLKYLNEIKNHFSPSSSGFLLESFLGGLIGGTVLDDNGPVDIVGDDRQTYQVKFFSWKTSHLKIKADPNDQCDNYIIALKDNDDIYIWRLIKPPANYSVPTRTNQTESEYLLSNWLDNGKIHATKLKKRKDLAIKINVSTQEINNKIRDISEVLMLSLKDIWDEISDLQYNIETIVSGVDKDSINVDDDKYDELYNNAKENLEELEDQLIRLKKGMGRR